MHNEGQIRIAIMSNAGGTGKTTMCVNLANELSLANYSVCLFGLDPNASLGMFLGIPNTTDDEDETLTSVLLNKNFQGNWPLIDCWLDRRSKVQVIVSGRELAEGIERLTVIDRKTEVLADRLEDYPLPHDFLIFDCPGTVDLVHKVALVACDFVLMPICPDAKGFFAASTLFDWFYTHTRILRLKPAPRILGVVPNRVQDNIQHKAVLGQSRREDLPALPDLLEEFEVPLFPEIKEYADISKSVMEGGLPLRAYRPGHPANQVFETIAQSVIQELSREGTENA